MKLQAYMSSMLDCHQYSISNGIRGEYVLFLLPILNPYGVRENEIATLHIPMLVCHQYSISNRIRGEIDALISFRRTDAVAPRSPAPLGA